MAPAPELWFSGPASILGDYRRQELLARGRRELAEARVQVMPILNDVRDHGDLALRRLTERFDGVSLADIRVQPMEFRAGVAEAPREDRKALQAMAKRLEAYHRRQVPEGFEARIDGNTLGWKPVPLDRVGIYVPGGQAAYPSTVLMAALPARLAGVREVAVCTPPRKDGTVHPLTLAACEAAGVTEVHRVGGAQAVFAMALGTKTIAPVQKVVGPGNVWVQAAKQMMMGHVGVDMVAGPSEVLVVADGSASPELAAWELAAQAEHDRNAAVVLVATEPAYAARVGEALAALVPKLERGEVIAAALRARGCFLTTEDLDEALDVANAFAPEHLVLLVREPRKALAKVRAAGSVFLGPLAPVAFGDYGAGTNHILPTSGNARFSSGLSVLDFVRWVQWQEGSAGGVKKVGPTAEHLARVEGLTAHAGAVAARAGRGKAPSRPARAKPARRRR